MPDSIELSTEECQRLLRAGTVGRVAVSTPRGPHIVPVNFIVEGDNVIFRSNFGLKFQLSVLAEHSISFEADLVDAEGHMAWSVVVQGRADLLSQEEMLAHSEATRSASGL